MRVSLSPVLGALLSFAVLGVPATAPRADGAKDMKQAAKAGRGGRFERAIELYSKAIHSGDLGDKKLAEAFRHRGRFALRTGDVGRAVLDLDAALRFRPLDAWSHDLMGQALAARGLLRRAETHAEMAVKLRPQWSSPRITRGYILFGRGRFAAAAGAFDAAIERKTERTFAAVVAHLSRRRAGDDDAEGARRAKTSVARKRWLTRILRMLRGEEAYEAIKARIETYDPKYHDPANCAVEFYAAQRSLLEAQDATARTHLEAARKICPPRLPEFYLAQAELERMALSAGAAAAK